MPRWPEKVEGEERFIALKAGPVVTRDGKHVIDETEPTGIGGPDGHWHLVQESGEGAERIRFITCPSCAQAAGWPKEGSSQSAASGHLPLSMAVDQ